LRDHEEEFKKRNVRIAVITFASSDAASRYREKTSLAWPLLVDEHREAYREYGMLSASFWDVWGPKTWWAYLTEVIKGQRLRKYSGDVYQRGGDVLIDPNGIVRLHHVGKGPADRPPAEEIVRMIDG